jgi:hypothetical protein
MTADDLRDAEEYYRRTHRRAEEAREGRNAAVHAALDAGWTHARIAEATGLTRSRVGQIALMDNVLAGRSTHRTEETG